MDANCENGAAPNISMNETSDGTTLYYSMNSSGDLGELEKTLEIEHVDEEPQISVEIPDFSLADPLAICGKFFQKNSAMLSSTPNKMPPLHAQGTAKETMMEEPVAVVKEAKDETLEEKNEDESTINGEDDYLKNTSVKVSEPLARDDKAAEKETDDTSQKVEWKVTEVEEYSVVRLKESLIRVVIEEEAEEILPSNDADAAQAKKDDSGVSKIDEDAKQSDGIPEEIAASGESRGNDEDEKTGEEIQGKEEEDKENIKDSSTQKKQRRRSKIAVATNPKEPKMTGKQSLIRRSILKTDVKSPAKLTKTAQFHMTKRSSLLPKNLPGNQKRQTIGVVGRVAGPPPPVKPKLPPAIPAPKADAPAAVKKRQTLAPNLGNPSGSAKRSPKGILTTKTAPVVNKSPKFLHPKDIKPPPMMGFECKVCRKKFRTTLVLDTHMKTHKDAAKGGFPCKYCDRRFDIKQGLDNHINRYCTKIPVGEKRRLLEEEAKNNALTPRTKRWIASSSKASDEGASSSSASSSSNLMTLLKQTPDSQGNKRRSVAFSGISATPNRTIKCYQCQRVFYDVFEFSDHITDHVAN